VVAFTVAAVCLAAAGCGSARTPAPGGSGAARPRTASAAGPPTAAGNKGLADREARRLLALVPVPAQAVAVSKPPGWPQPERPIATSVIDKYRVWRLPMSFSRAAAWIKAHPPAGVGAAERFSSQGRDLRAVGYAYDNGPSSPAWASAWLQVEVAPSGPGHSVMRADGIVIWLDPVPMPADTAGRRVHVTVSGGCPRTDRSVVGVTNNGADLKRRLLPAAAPVAGLECLYYGLNQHPFQLRSVTHLAAAGARHVARNMLMLPVAHATGEMFGCAMDDGSAAIVALSYPGRADVDLWVALTGCGGVGNGFIEAGGPGAGTATGHDCAESGWLACLRR